MTPLLKELSSLEVEPLEVRVRVPESGQVKSLDTLTTMPAEIAALLIGRFPVNDGDCCCCCCCPACCC